MNYENNEKNRIAIFHYSGTFDSSPSLINASNILAKNEYFIDVISIKTDESIQNKLYAPNIFLYYSPWKKPHNSREIISNLFKFILTARNVLKNKHYKCLIGVDSDGLISAAILGFFKKIPIIYYSLELFISKEKKGMRRRIKKSLERFCHKTAKLTIIQDENRANLLLKDNKLPNAEVLIVPNSTISTSKEIVKTKYLKKIFDIKTGSLILIQAGGIAEWNKSLELVQSTHTWPEDWVLVLHGRCEDKYYLDKIKNNYNREKVILSLKPVQYDQLDELIQSADIGLALYQNRGANFFHVASGKIFHYMKNGLPVITMDFPNLVDIVEKNGCGICIKDEKEIVHAAKSILRDYESYSFNAFNVFKEKYDFEKHFISVLNRLRMI